MLGMTHHDQYLSIIIDAMDQSKTYLPVVLRRAKNDSVDFLKQKLMGVLVHGHGAYVYVLHPPVKSGANFTLECIWRTLMKLDHKYKVEKVPWPRTLMLQLDNASDNKAYSILTFCSYLVECGVFGEIKLSYLIVGHTHEDIDQFFSVISQHFASLQRGVVISFEDFATEVVGSFKVDNTTKRPKCVELVEAVHDFAAWLKKDGGQEQTVSNITAFRSFVIRQQTPVELQLPNELYQRPDNFELAAVMTVKEYMTSPESESKPDEVKWREKGPVIMLKKHPFGEPELEAFKDLALEPKERKGIEVKPRPKAWEGKCSGDILQIIHEGLVGWLNNPSNGASQEQRAAFATMLARKVGVVSDLSPEVLSDLPKWALPVGWPDSPVRVRDGVKSAADIVVVEIDASSMVLAKPSQDIYYKETTRSKRKKLKDWEEMQLSVKVLPEIPEGSTCLVQTCTAERGLEWWFGIAQQHYPECSASEETREAPVQLQWMSVQWKHGNGGLVPPNVFEDVSIKPWWVEKKGSKKGQKNLENQPRSAVALVGATFTKQSALTLATKNAVVGLGCGFEMKSGKLVYTWVKDAASRATSMEAQPAATTIKTKPLRPKRKKHGKEKRTEPDTEEDDN